MNHLFKSISLIILAIATIACGGDTGGTGPTPTVLTFTPAPGNYDSAQNVTVTNPGASAIYVTTDGSTPTSAQCGTYDGSAIEVAETTVINVLYVDGLGEHSDTGTYTFDAQSSVYANDDMRLAWMGWEYEISCQTRDGCANQVQPHDINCEDGGNVDYELLGLTPSEAHVKFTYNNCKMTSVELDTSVASTLTVNGTTEVWSELNAYTPNGDGTTITSVNMTGTWNGSLNANLVIDNSAKTGSYVTSCSDAGCDSTSVSYIAPNWNEAANPTTPLTCP